MIHKILLRTVNFMFFRQMIRYFRKIRGLRLDWAQVEVTTRCNATCTYCPHTILNTVRLNEHMPLDFFQKICFSDLTTNGFD